HLPPRVPAAAPPAGKKEGRVGGHEAAVAAHGPVDSAAGFGSEAVTTWVAACYGLFFRRRRPTMRWMTRPLLIDRILRPAGLVPLPVAGQFLGRRLEHSMLGGPGQVGNVLDLDVDTELDVSTFPAGRIAKNPGNRAIPTQSGEDQETLGCSKTQ